MTHTHLHIKNYQTEGGYDPTKSTTLRNTFARKMRGRVRKLRTIVREAIQSQDRFKNLNNSENVELFISWLDKQIQSEVISLTQVRNNVDVAWTTRYVNEAYRKGVQRARSEIRREGKDIPTVDEEGGFEAILQLPIHTQTYDNLAYNAITTLREAMQDLKKNIRRVMLDSLSKGHSNTKIAQRIDSLFSGTARQELGLTALLGKFVAMLNRVEMIARTEIVRVIAESTLAEYQYWGIEKIGLLAEWETAGDNRVCPYCKAMAARGPYDITEAQGLIPAHPRCRCYWLPILT